MITVTFAVVAVAFSMGSDEMIAGQQWRYATFSWMSASALLLTVISLKECR